MLTYRAEEVIMRRVSPVMRCIKFYPGLWRFISGTGKRMNTCLGFTRKGVVLGR